MAGNKINTKKKDDKNKSSRNADSAMEESEDIDFSLLRKPILTSITGFAQARKIFDLATEELKGLLSDECDLLYECKVCRNMFRSLANFISHKRVFCKEKFNSSVHGHFLKETSVMQEVMKIKKLEEGYQESLSEKVDTNNEDEEDDSRIPITKDLTSIIEKITKNKGVGQNEVENSQLVFQKIPKSSVAVFQNIEGDTKSDPMKAQLEELNDLLSRENAVLQSDGSFKVQSSDKVALNTDTATPNTDSATPNTDSATLNTDKAALNTDNVIQISDDDENEDSDILKCKICDLQFSTLKTLKFHIKYKHLENRLVYPCPDCLDIFSTSWSVYRHLFKVHRKTAAQIRRLRESIQAKAFRMNNPPAFYEKRKTAPKSVPALKISEEERLYKENQAWLEELDGESEGRRCGGCGRAFERRAALAAHTHTCARRHRRRIQIQIRKDYHKEPGNPYLSAHRPTDTKSSTEEVQIVEKIQEDKDTKDDEEDKVDDEPPEAEPLAAEDAQQTEEMDTEEPVIQNKPKFYDTSMINKLPFAQQTEKNNLNAFRQKIRSDVDLFKLLCKKCDLRYDKIEDFLNHMSGHYKWVRYACKLCNFKHFNFDKLPEHVKVVHKLKGNTEFYYSTVKAIDGAEALELSETVDEQNEANEGPGSRRPSRCSSDSSRVSDDSSNSSTRLETGSRKRKRNMYKNNAKKKRDALVADDTDQKEDDIGESDTNLTNKMFEENSSDFDEVEEKISKQQNVEITSSVASRRPVRKRTKPKNADFEYDLSNLLKMEAQGYRDSQTASTNNTKIVQSKKKVQQELLNNYDVINKESCGAMVTLSRKSVENAQGHMKTASFPVFKSSKESRISSIFARPMIPRITKVDRISPKKVETEGGNNTSTPSKTVESSSSSTSIVKDLTFDNNAVSESEPEILQTSTQSTQSSTNIIRNPKDSIKVKSVEAVLNNSNKDVNDKTKVSLNNDETTSNPVTVLNNSNKDVNDKSKVSLFNDETTSKPVTETEKVGEKKLSLSKLESNSDNAKHNVYKVPIKFRRQGLEVIKNPLIKRNITDFTKAGMKTKILVIKPINRNADGTKNLNGPLKFQTIKLKDPSKSSAKGEEKKSDQIVVVQVPQVDSGITRPIPTSIVNDRISPGKTDSSQTSIVEKEKFEKDVPSNTEQKPNSDEKTHTAINSTCDEEAHISNETQLKGDEKALNSDEKIIDKKICDKIQEENNEENLDQKNLKDSECDHVTSETNNEVKEVLMDSHDIVSQDS